MPAPPVWAHPLFALAALALFVYALYLGSKAGLRRYAGRKDLIFQQKDHAFWGMIAMLSLLLAAAGGPYLMREYFAALAVPKLHSHGAVALLTCLPMAYISGSLMAKRKRQAQPRFALIHSLAVAGVTLAGAWQIWSGAQLARALWF